MASKPVHEIILSKETLIPLGFVIVILGGVVWLTTMFANVQANSRAIASIEARLDGIDEANSDIVDRMARIETKIDLLLDN